MYGSREKSLNYIYLWIIGGRTIKYFGCYITKKNLNSEAEIIKWIRTHTVFGKIKKLLTDKLLNLEIDSVEEIIKILCIWSIILYWATWAFSTILNRVVLPRRMLKNSWIARMWNKIVPIKEERTKLTIGKLDSSAEILK